MEIGDNTVIYGNVTIFPGARIGSGVTIFPGAVVAGVPQDTRNSKGKDLRLHRRRNHVARMRYGQPRHCRQRRNFRRQELSHYGLFPYVAHDCKVGNRVIISNASQLAGEVQIDDCAVIGGGKSGASVLPSRQEHHVLQGGALVNKDIPPFVKAAREPISYVGNQHNRSSPQRVLTRGHPGGIGEVYRLLYLSDLNVTNAVKLIMQTLPQSVYRDEIVDFVVNSERGIIRSAV